MKNKLIHEGFEFEVLYNWDCLQRIARHPKYTKLYKDLQFDKDGFAVKDFLGEGTSALDIKWPDCKRQAREKYDELKKNDVPQADKYLRNFPLLPIR